MQTIMLVVMVQPCALCAVMAWRACTVCGALAGVLALGHAA
jgi:hypothetical protein